MAIDICLISIVFGCLDLDVTSTIRMLILDNAKLWSLSFGLQHCRSDTSKTVTYQTANAQRTYLKQQNNQLHIPVFSTGARADKLIDVERDTFSIY